MKKYIYFMGIFLALLLKPLYAVEFEESKEIEKIFKTENINGTFVLYDVQKNILNGYNEARATKQYQPASTFKIPNSLIGISLGLVKDVNDVFYKYDGTKLWIESWEKDVSLNEAIKLSHLPAFQQLALKIGLKKMQENIKKMNYGNKNIGKNGTMFWLRGPLKISAIEQAYFLAKLAEVKLPYSQSAQESVIQILKLESGDGWNLYGKTGWATKDQKNKLNPTLGWFVGWVEKNGNIYTFALNMDIKNSSQLPLRQKIAMQILKMKLELY